MQINTRPLAFYGQTRPDDDPALLERAAAHSLAENEAFDELRSLYLRDMRLRAAGREILVRGGSREIPARRVLRRGSIPGEIPIAGPGGVQKWVTYF